MSIKSDPHFPLAGFVVTLGHEPADKGLIDAVCDHFARLIRHHDDTKRPNAQDCATFVWALATLGHEPADKDSVNAVCNHFVKLIRHHDTRKRPTTQGVSNVMWALAELNHAPPDGAASAVSEWFTRLGKLPGQEPNAQDLGSTLSACAVLRVKVKGHVSLALVNGLLRLDRAHSSEQVYCNAAWGLAVLDLLSVDIFLLIVERLQPLPIADPAHDSSVRQQLNQVYQALDSLQPLPAFAAQQLQQTVTRLGPRPLPEERTAAGQSASKHLCAALGQLGLAFTANVPLSGYQAAAVLQPRDGVTVPVVLVTKAWNHFRNKDGRCVFFLWPLYITVAMHSQKGNCVHISCHSGNILSHHTMRNSNEL